MADLPLPIEFRAEIIQPVLSLLQSGESCALVGVGSSGKSNIARHLARADVRLHYLGADVTQVVLLYLNCTPYAHRPLHELYLHALDQLDRAVEELNGPYAPIRPGVSALLKEAQANPESLARRNLDVAIGQCIRSGARHVIVMLDDCDDLFRTASGGLFSDLRSLRDNYKVRLVYLTLSRREPAFLRSIDDTPEYEELFELISADGHTIPATPYTEADGFFMLQRLAARQNPPRLLADAEVRRLYELSGGHAGLLRSLFFATRRGTDLLSLDIVERLTTNAEVDSECRRILASLEDEEQAALHSLVAQETPAEGELRRLQRRGLVRPRGRGPEVFSPVFERFLGLQAGLPSRSSLRIEFTSIGTQVRVNEQLITNLIRPEFEILRKLVAERPRPCSRMDLITVMRMAEQSQPSAEVRGDPLSRLDQYVKQLKAKLGPAGHLIQPESDGYSLVA